MLKVYFHLPYRQTEGIAQGHAKGKVPSIPDFTTICKKRINILNIEIKDDGKNKEVEDEYIIIAIDNTGIKVTNRGQWIETNGIQAKTTRKLFKNTCCCKCKNQENTFNEGY